MILKMCLIVDCRLKKEKSEQFAKRQMGEKGLTKQEKEALRKKKQQLRDEFDLANSGNYKLAYPVLNNPEKAKRFDGYLEQAKINWSELSGGQKAAAAAAS